MSHRPTLPSPTATGIALRFVSELQAGRRPSIETALDQAPRDEWAGLLQSLLIAETNHRRSRGEAPVAREYLARFPAHGEVVRAVVPDVSPRPAPVVAFAEPAIVTAPPVQRAAVAAPEPQPAVPMALLLPQAFEDLEPEVEFTPPLPRRRRRWRLIGGGVIALAAAAAVLLFLLPPRQRVTEGPAPGPGGPGAGPKGGPKIDLLGTKRPASADPERDLADWVLQVGGRGTLLPEGASRRPFTADAPIPRVPFAVTAITLPVEAASRWKPADLDRLHGRSQLTSVVVHSNVPFTEAMLAPLAGLPLRFLELHGNPVLASGAFFAAFPDLETLTIPTTPEFSDTDLAALGKLGKLTSLSLNSPKLTVKGFQELKASPLRALSLGADVTLTPDHVRVLKDTLEEFESGAGMTDDVFLEFAVFQELKRIHLRRTTLTDAGLKAVVGLGKLEDFRVDGSAITGPGIEHLAERKGLRVVDLSGAKLTNDAVPLLLSLPPLRELRIAGSAITDQSAGLLAQLEGVELLDLGETGVSDATLQMLKKHATLTTLIVTNTKVTGPGVRDFEAGTPGCKVVFGKRK